MVAYPVKALRGQGINNFAGMPVMWIEFNGDVLPLPFQKKSLIDISTEGLCSPSQ